MNYRAFGALLMTLGIFLVLGLLSGCAGNLQVCASERLTKPGLICNFTPEPG